MADKITRALVTAPTFINGVLHMPGEVAAVDLDALGIKELGDRTPGLEAHSAKHAERVVQAPIAAVAPHAPDAPNPQGLPTGTVQSGTGRLVQVDSMAGGSAFVEPAGSAETVEPVGADATVLDKSGQSQTPVKPSKGK